MILFGDYGLIVEVRVGQSSINISVSNVSLLRFRETKIRNQLLPD